MIHGRKNKKTFAEFLRNSEALASKFLEYHKEAFLQYYIASDVITTLSLLLYHPELSIFKGLNLNSNTQTCIYPMYLLAYVNT